MEIFHDKGEVVVPCFWITWSRDVENVACTNCSMNRTASLQHSTPNNHALLNGGGGNSRKKPRLKGCLGDGILDISRNRRKSKVLEKSQAAVWYAILNISGSGWRQAMGREEEIMYTSLYSNFLPKATLVSLQILFWITKHYISAKL